MFWLFLPLNHRTYCLHQYSGTIVLSGRPAELRPTPELAGLDSEKLLDVLRSEGGTDRIGTHRKSPPGRRRRVGVDRGLSGVGRK